MERGHPLLHNDLLDAKALRPVPYLDDLEQVERRLRGGSETVGQLMAEAVNILVLGHGVELPVKLHSLRDARDVVVGQERLVVDRDLSVCHELGQSVILSHIIAREKFLELGGFKLNDGLGEHLLVGLVAHVCYEARLLSPEDVSSTADVKVLHGDIEARAEVGKLLDNLQPPARLLRKGGEWRREKIAKGLLIASPDAPAELMELAKPEEVRIVYDNRIGVRYVEPALDDGSGQKHVIVAINKVEHDALKLRALHLPVRYDRADVGQQPAKHSL